MWAGTGRVLPVHKVYPPLRLTILLYMNVIILVIATPIHPIDMVFSLLQEAGAGHILQHAHTPPHYNSILFLGVELRTINKRGPKLT